MKSKAAVAKALTEKGIPLPEEDTFDALMHRFNSWEAKRGFLFRRIRSRHFARQQLPLEIPLGTVIFVPASQFARKIMKTGAMFPLGRAEYNPDLHTLIDVPKKTTAPKKSSSEKVKKSDNNKSNSKSNS